MFVDLKSPIPRIMWNFVTSGIVGDSNLEKLRKLIIINLVLFFAVAILMLHTSLAIINGDILLAGANFTTFMVAVFLFYQLRKTKNPNIFVAFMVVFAGLYFMFLIGYGGGSKSVFLWVLVYPIFSILLVGIKKGTIATTLLLLSVIVLFYLGGKVSALTYYPLGLISRFIFVYMTIIFFILSMDWTRMRVYAHIEKSNKSLMKNQNNLKKINDQKGSLIESLQVSLKELKLLHGLLPICRECKKIRDDAGYWKHLESYISANSEAVFSHGICPDCAEDLYSEYLSDVASEEDKQTPK